MSGFGSFSQEAYQQLQEAYSAQLLAANEAEEAGVQVGNERFSVETGAVSSPWLEKTGLWQYPSGKGDHMDVKQSPEDLLAALRNEDGEVVSGLVDEEEDQDLDELSDEELDAFIDEILEGLDESEGDEESSDEETEAVADEAVAEVEEEEDPEVIAQRIEELKQELDTLSRFLAESQENEEEEDTQEDEENVEATDEDTQEEEDSE
jgi:hypothetical protein